MQTGQSVPTLDDVAKHAGVSTATVSRCLNLPERVAKATLDRVMKSVDALGYTPNFGARAMAARRTHTIGAVIPTMENAIFARGIQAFQEELRRLGYQLLVSSSLYDPEVEQQQIRALVARGADALLLIGHARSPDIYDYLKRQDVPVLVAWSYAEGYDQPSIGFDNRASMRRLAEHVLALGHRRIGVISAPAKGNDRAEQRLTGIRDALAAGGLDPAGIRVIETPYGIQNGATALDALVGDTPRPTAVICGNDVLAVGAMRRAQERGLRVPQDISVTGFDDIEIARIVTPPLTTVHVPHQEMGRRAATQLVSILDRQSDGASVALDTTLCLRGSLAAVPEGC